MKKNQTTLEEFRAQNGDFLRQEELILNVTEELAAALCDAGFSKTELAPRLGKSKAFVSQVLGGGQNLTLRTLADLAFALDSKVEIRLSRAVTTPVLGWPPRRARQRAIVRSGDR